VSDKLRALGVEMLRHPLAQRFVGRSYASGDNRVRTADDVLGERIARLGALLTIEAERPGLTVLAKPKERTREQALIDVSAYALSATPYLWTEEIRLALREIELPRHVLSPRLLPQPRTWHTFFTGLQLRGKLTDGGRHYEGETADAQLVCDAGVGFNVLTLGDMRCVETGEQHPTVTGTSFRYGATYPDDFDADQRNVLSGPLAMFAFLNSPFIPKRRERASRAARRELARTATPLDDEHVTFVVLRRPAARREPGDDEERAVDWKHQWLVSGHVRAQWYPSEQAHRLIWIAPYLKGPPDAPMLEHAYKVAR
jgi:hypothetical protein